MPTPPQPFYDSFPGPAKWAGARRERLDIMVQGKITKADTPTIRLGATPSRLTSAHLHHPIFYRSDALPAAQPTVSKDWRQFTDANTLNLHFWQAVKTETKAMVWLTGCSMLCGSTQYSAWDSDLVVERHHNRSISAETSPALQCSVAQWSLSLAHQSEIGTAPDSYRQTSVSSQIQLRIPHCHVMLVVTCFKGDMQWFFGC